MDRVGTRRGLSITVVAYSLVSVLTSLARGFYSFATFRFLLGAGESGNWPAATKAVSEWFPKRERGFEKISPTLTSSCSLWSRNLDFVSRKHPEFVFTNTRMSFRRVINPAPEDKPQKAQQSRYGKCGTPSPAKINPQNQERTDRAPDRRPTVK